MGRARQPVSLLEYKGNKNLTKEEIEKRKSQEVKAPADKVKPPTYLDRNSKRKFKKLADELVKLELMSNLDVDTLARYLLSEKEYLRVTEQVEKMDPVIEEKDDDGIGTGFHFANQEYSALLINQDRLFKQCRTLASDLGLTITSRCRLVVPKSDDNKEKTPEEKMFGDV
jgi:P27 family predicted phage terminase small subunit